MSLDGPSGLSKELAALKQQGASLLVVGDESGGVCSSLLGVEGQARRAIFVPTVIGVADVRKRWPGPESAGRFAVIDVGGTRRPDVITAPTVGDPGIAPGDAEWYEKVSIDDPGALVSAVRRRLDRLAADDPPAATIRFCLDSLDPLYDELGEDRLFRLMTTLCLSVTGVDGMAHVHVSPGLPDGMVETLEPLFDATIEIERGAAGDHKQRWHLHDSGIETDWLAV